MSKTRFLIAFMLSIGFWDHVLAYDFEQAVYLPQGIKVGGFMLYHKLDINNQYDSNIYKRDIHLGVVDSYIAHFRPGFEINSDWNQHALNFSFDSDFTQYAIQSGQNNYQDIMARLDGRLDVVRDSYMDMAFTFSSIHEDRGSPDQIAGSTPTFYDTKQMQWLYTHKFNLISVKGGLDAMRFDYQDTSTASGTQLQMSTRSHWEYMPSIQLGYEIQEGHEAFVKFMYKTVDYDTLVLVNGVGTAFQRNSYGYNVLGGMDLDLTDLVSGSISIGYLSRTYSDVRLQNISGINGSVDLKWLPTALTTVQANISRDIQETTQTNASGYLSTGFSLNVDHELLRDILLQVGVSYTNNEYQGFDPNNPILQNRKNRNEDVYSANAGVKYLWNSNFSMDLMYRFESRDSNYLFTNYDVNTVMFNVTGQF